jgi:hypothetical protein
MRDGEGIEQLDAAALTQVIGGRCHAVALLAEDDTLMWRGHLPECGEVAVRPALAVQLPHGRLVLSAGEERVGVGSGPPERDQIAVWTISETEAADKSGCV